MTREKRAAQRRRQIIDATVRCMAANGISGTTLERIADTAGMARGHIRHFSGNRDELLIDTARVFFFGDAALSVVDVDELARTSPLVPPGSDVDATLDYLFGEFAVPGSENAAVSAFLDAARTMPAIRQVIVAAYSGIEDSIAEALRARHPGLDDSRYRGVAYAVLTIAMGNNLIGDIEGMSLRPDDARSVAERAIAALAS